MKKRDIWISVAIIVVAVLFLFLYSQAKGQIKIDAGGADTTLRLSNNWLSTTTVGSGARPGKVRARLHKPQWLKLSMKQDADTWRLESRGPWGDLSTIRVKNNETKVLKLGPPFQIQTKVHRRVKVVSIDFAIIGRAGERYRNSIMLNNKRAPAPKVKIINENGGVLASGKFEYG